MTQMPLLGAIVVALRASSSSATATPLVREPATGRDLISRMPANPPGGR
jgi:hypothetical protein